MSFLIIKTLMIYEITNKIEKPENKKAANDVVKTEFGK
tara:strand:- start:2631 stop:2744 length:114 start_codon:yes stop_codon:yes gene_type:complete